MGIQDDSDINDGNSDGENLAGLVKLLRHRITTLEGVVDVLGQNQRRVLITIDGDKQLRVIGVLDRLATIELMLEKWRQYTWMLRGVSVVVGFLGVTNITTIVTLASIVLGKAPIP
jgi:hypothetical protein